MSPTRGRLQLQDGSSFSGRILGCERSVAGEVVFNTGMVGYTEALTDPSYAGQILVMTYPLVGNYGVPDGFESPRIQAAALVVAELSAGFSHAAARRSLGEWLRDEGIPCLAGVDTRALAKRLRTQGCMAGTLLAEGAPLPLEDAARRNLVGAVSVPEVIRYRGGRKRVALVDCGAKQSIIEELRAREASIIRVPWDYDFLREDFDAVLVSNGPGDPSANLPTIRNLARAVALGRPIMGICLGHQLLALAAGARTYKLKFGHRGHNQPCVESGSRRCYITSQNHGYAVDEATLPDGWAGWFTNANDGSNEGIRHRSRPFFGVQFHPEAAPGPVDSRALFDDFLAMVP